MTVCARCGNEYDKVCAFCADMAETRLEPSAQAAKATGRNASVASPSGRQKPVEETHYEVAGVEDLDAVDESIMHALEKMPRFKTDKLRDQGESGAWFRAQNLENERKVNLHMKHVPPLTDIPTQRRFFDGLRKRGDVRHPNLAVTQEIGQVDACIYIVEDCPPGVPLSELMRQRPGKERRYRLRIILRVLEAVIAFHDAGLPGHQLDPRKILVGDQGETLLLDQAFPLPYELPEEFDPNVTPVIPSADSWLSGEIRAAGELIYQILTGEEFVPVGEVALPQVGKQLEAIVLRALQPDPAKQWPSMRALHRALDRELRRRQKQGNRGLLPWVLASTAVLVLLLVYELAFRGNGSEPISGGNTGAPEPVPEVVPEPVPEHQPWMDLLPPPLPAPDISPQEARESFDAALAEQNFRLVAALLEHKLVAGGPELYSEAEQAWFASRARQIEALSDAEAARTAWLGVLGKVADPALAEQAARGVWAAGLELEAAEAFEAAESFAGFGMLDPAWAQLRTLESLYEQTRYYEGNLEAIISLKQKVISSEKDQAMVKVHYGGFVRGADPEAMPVRTVVLSEFWIDSAEVTWKRYRFFVQWFKQAGDHRWCHPEEPPDKDHLPEYIGGKLDVDEHPVVGIDFWDAWAYAGYWSKQLPSEAQWEKAARGDDARSYPWGNDWSNLCGQSSETLGDRTDYLRENGLLIIEGGSWQDGRSPYGLVDVAGNVAEWCRDAFSPTAYSQGGLVDPFHAGRADDTRVVRGGSFRSSQAEQCCFVRDARAPDTRADDLGFRCVWP